MNKYLKKYSEIWKYIVFGIITTFINIIIYYFFYEVLSLKNILSNILAWILSVIFAYLTNKNFVFKSYKRSIRDIIKEFFYFLLCRISTGGLDVILMYIVVEKLYFKAIIMKVFINFIVIIFNFFGSKIIFKYKEKN